MSRHSRIKTAWKKCKEMIANLERQQRSVERMEEPSMRCKVRQRSDIFFPINQLFSMIVYESIGIKFQQNILSNSLFYSKL